MKNLWIFIIISLLLMLANRAFAQKDYDSVTQSYGTPVSQTLSTSGGGVVRSDGQERLFGSEVTNDDLLEIDKTNAKVNILGSMSSPIVAALAYDAPSGLLYATDTSSTSLLRINPFNGNVTVIGLTGLSLPHGAAIDPADGTLYVADDNPGTLYKVDKTTGQPSLVGVMGPSHIGALDFDPVTGTLYGAYGWSDGTGALYTISTSNGQATFVASTHRINGLSFDAKGNLYASENGLSSGVPSSLYTIDKTNGNWNLIGSMGVDNVLGLKFASPALYVDVASISSAVGGTAMFTLAGGPGNANRNFLLLGSVSGTSPGIKLPGGLEILPLKWDFFTNIVIQYANGPNFINFMSKLDGTGSAPATFILPPGTGASGIKMYYAYALNKPYDFVSNPVVFQIVP